jgi:hypothetical protein
MDTVGENSEKKEEIAAKVAEPKRTEVVFDLQDGRKCKIIKGKGIHVIRAQRLIDPNNRVESYNTALYAMCCTIDDKPVLPDDLLELPMNDYHNFIAYFDEVNF